MTDAELSQIIRTTYRRIVVRNRGFKEQALRTCEAMLRIHRATEGRTIDRMRIVRMLTEESLDPSQRSSTWQTLG
jgi:hypothetical protein